MRVCLISPPTVTEFEDRQVAESEAVRLVAEQAPIGILTLAAVLEERGIDVQVFDLNKLYYTYLYSRAQGRRALDFCAYVTQSLASLSFDVFGFGSICSTYPLTIRIAHGVRNSHPHATIMLGGPQASVVDVPTLKAFPFIDLIVRGEAEETLPLILNALSDPVRLKGILGLTFRFAGSIVRNPNAPVILDLDQLPMPAFHLYPGLGASQRVPLELGRGCPFACTFCSTNDFFRRRFRLKRPQKVIEQMQVIRRVYGNNHFELIHDMFTVDRKRVVEFCEVLLASGEGFHWNCSARTDCIDDELIALMARAGCRGIFFGIETGSARLQPVIDKGQDLTEAASRIRSAAEHQIDTTVSLITGFPDETQEDFKSTVGFLMDSARFDRIEPQLHILAPLAGTPIHDQNRERLVLDDVLSDMSHHGWRQDPEDRALIASRADIFPNFYAVPTPGLDRKYIKQVRDFILHAMEHCRWLLVALHQHSGDLLRVFEEWKAWVVAERGGECHSAARTGQYYASSEFRRDLLTFVHTRYLPRAGKSRRSLSALLKYELALDQAAPAKPARRASSTPRIAQEVRIIRLHADYQRILECLRNKRDLGTVPARQSVLVTRIATDRRVEILQLSSMSAQLLALCDGTRSIKEIVARFSLPENIRGISPSRACLFGLAVLREQGLIDLR